MGLKHNKKRNIGLLEEFFARHIAGCVVENRHESIPTASNLWGKYKKPGTELYKESKLFEAIAAYAFGKKSLSQSVSVKLIEQAKTAAAKIDPKKLDEEKTSLIREVNSVLKNDNFFNQSIANYNNYATIQILLNGWISNSINESRLNPTMLELEDKVLTWMQESKEEKSVDEKDFQNMKIDEEINFMVVDIMRKKMAHKYSSFNEEQERLLGAYLYRDSSYLEEKISFLRTSTQELINEELKKETPSKQQKDKLKEINDLLKEDTSTTVDDDRVALYMRIAQLNAELKEEK